MEFGLISRETVKVGSFYLGLDRDQAWKNVHGGMDMPSANAAALVCGEIYEVDQYGFKWRDKVKGRTGHEDFPINRHVGTLPTNAEHSKHYDPIRCCDVPGIVLTKDSVGKVSRLVSLPFLDDLVVSLLDGNKGIDIKLSAAQASS